MLPFTNPNGFFLNTTIIGTKNSTILGDEIQARGPFLEVKRGNVILTEKIREIVSH